MKVYKQCNCCCFCHLAPLLIISYHRCQFVFVVEVCVLCVHSGLFVVYELAGDLLVCSCTHRESNPMLLCFVYLSVSCVLLISSIRRERLEAKIVKAINEAKSKFSVSVVHRVHFPGCIIAHKSQTCSQKQPQQR